MTFTSLLVHAEWTGSAWRTRDRDGFFLLIGRRQRLHQGHLLQRHAGADGKPEQMQLLLEDPSLIPVRSRSRCGCSRRLRISVAQRRGDTELHGQQIKEGEKVVMWYVSSNRGRRRATRPRSLRRQPQCEHQAFGGRRPPLLPRHGARRASSCASCSRRRSSATQSRARGRAGGPQHVESVFLNQLKTLPVRL